MDLAGHEKYFKTTAYGLTGHLPGALHWLLASGFSTAVWLVGVGMSQTIRAVLVTFA